MKTKEIKAVLRYYKALCVYIEGRKDCEKNGVEYTSIFPCLIDENAIKTKFLIYNAIRQAIEDMDDPERFILQQKYFEDTNIIDRVIYLDMGITKERYYQIKKKALNRISEAFDKINVK